MENKAFIRGIIISAVVAFVVPAMSLFKIKDILPVAGFERLEAIPKLSWTSFKTRQMQTAVETRIAKKFFLRGLMYRTRCQFMEFLNLGASHEGYNQGIGQYRDGSLFEYFYFRDYYNPNCQVKKDIADNVLSAMGELGKVLASNGVDMIFVMAPDKVQFSQKPLAGLTSVLFKKRRDEFQTEFGHLLSSYGISSFDTFSFLTAEAPKHSEPMFPYAGTHWNALASSLVVDELLAQLNRTTPRPYVINHFRGVYETHGKSALFSDEDIGRLLNLLRNPYLAKNKSYLPMFESEEFAPNNGSVIIFGDSFSWGLARSMKLSADFAPEKILVCDKRCPTADELDYFISDLRLVLFVYMTPNMLRLGDHNAIGEKVVPFCHLLENQLRNHKKDI